MLDRVFFNLLANAFKFLNAKGTIRVNIKKDEEFALVEVLNNGVGLTAEEAENIFDQFYQGEQATSVGSGIGLALSREIILLHRGRIEVDSEKWKGTTFKISLPLGNDHLSPDEMRGNNTVSQDVAERFKPYIADLEKIEGAYQADSFSRLKEHSILIVKDNPDPLSYLGDKLGDQYEIFTSNNGMAGVNEALEQVPDLIISDVVLPEISGKALYERLKSDFGLPIFRLSS
jgi:hypothetical protein